MQGLFSREIGNGARIARIPVSIVAVMVLLFSMISGTYLYGLDMNRMKDAEPKLNSEVDQAAKIAAEDIEDQAYYIAEKVIQDAFENNVLSPGDGLQDDLEQLNPEFQKRYDDYLEETFERMDHDRQFRIAILDHLVFIVFEEKHTVEFFDQYGTSQAWSPTSPSYVSSEQNTALAGNNALTDKTVYFRVVGKVRFELRHLQSGHTFEKEQVFDRNSYIPLPLLKTSFDGMQAAFNSTFGEGVRIVRYILTMLTYYRILMGYCDGKYTQTGAGFKPIADVLTQEDIKLALYLAVLLEEARRLRDHDYRTSGEDQTPIQVDSSKFPSRGGQAVQSLMENYCNYGIVDGADLFALYDSLFKDEKFDVGGVFGQAIYGFADKFEFDLLRLFWPQDIWGTAASWEDPTLYEPLTKNPPGSNNPKKYWDAIYDMGEGKAKNMLLAWLWFWNEAFALPHSIPTFPADEEDGRASIEAQKQDVTYVSMPNWCCIIIPCIITPYFECCSMECIGSCDECGGCPGPQCLIIPSWISGTYTLFSTYGTQDGTAQYWWLKFYPDPASKQNINGKSVQTELLMLGESSAPNMRPLPFIMKCWSTDEGESGGGGCDEEEAWDYLPDMEYKYYMVYESLIKKHAKSASTAYRDTLYYIMESINMSVKRRDDLPATPIGLMDDMAKDASQNIGQVAAKGSLVDGSINPKDQSSLLKEGLTDARDLIYIPDGLNKFKSRANSEKDNYWEEGAYHEGDYSSYSDWPKGVSYGPPKAKSNGEQGANFLWRACAESADLCFELFWTFMKSSDFNQLTWGDDYIDAFPATTQFKQQMDDGYNDHEEYAGKTDYFNWKYDALRDCFHRAMTNVYNHIDEFHSCNYDCDDANDDGKDYWSQSGECQFCCAGIQKWEWDTIPLIAWASYGDGTTLWKHVKSSIQDAVKTVLDQIHHTDDCWDEEGAQHYVEQHLDPNAEGVLGGYNGHNVDQNYQLWASDSFETFVDDGAQGDANGAMVGRTVKHDIDRLSGNFNNNEWWLDKLIREKMFNHLFDAVDTTNDIIFQVTNESRRPGLGSGEKYDLWEGELNAATYNKTVMNETTLVFGQDDVDTSSLGNYIWVSDEANTEIKGYHIADAQDDFRAWTQESRVYNEATPSHQNLAEAPYLTRWEVKFKASVNIHERTLRYSVPSSGEHVYTWHNDTVYIKGEFPIDVYTGWNLTGIYYPKCRGYFEEKNGLKLRDKDTKSSPFFISTEFENLVNGAKVATDWSLDCYYKVQDYACNLLNEMIEKDLNYSKSISDGIKMLMDSLKSALSSNYGSTMMNYKNALKTAASGYINIDTEGLRINDLPFFDLGIEQWRILKGSSAQLQIRINQSSNFDFTFEYTQNNVKLTKGWMKFWNFSAGDYSGTEITFDGAQKKFKYQGYYNMWGDYFRFELEAPKRVQRDYATTFDPSGGKAIYLPALNASLNVEIGIFGFSNSGSAFTNPINVGTARYNGQPYRGNTAEHVVTIAKAGLGNLLDSSSEGSLAGSDRCGIYLDITGFPNEPNKRMRFTVMFKENLLESSTTDYAKARWQFVIWAQNNMREIVYNLGESEAPQEMYANLPWKPSEKMYQHVFIRIDNYTSSSEPDVYMESNAAGTMSALEFITSDWDNSDSQAYQRMTEIEFGTYTTDWQLQGTIYRTLTVPTV